MIFPSVNINGTDMLNEYRMALATRHCVQPPVPKNVYKDIPGADSSLDLSEANTGHMVYERRKITLVFGTGRRKKEWPELFSEILRRFHGKEGKIIFDDDPAYYYLGRMTVLNYERAQTLGKFTIEVMADPYKYELQTGDEDWLWDPFSFVNGIIREYGNIKVNGSYRLVIPGREKWVIPEITVSSDMTVQFGGTVYELKAGKNKIYGIVIKEGENVLVFNGKGMLSVKYRGGIL